MSPKLGESRAAADVGRVQTRAPLPRPGVPLPRPGLRAGPGGSGPPARRGPLRGGGRAHLPPGRLPPRLPSSHSRRTFPCDCLPFCLVLSSSLHCPHSWWSRPRPAPPTFVDVELSVLPTESVLFFSKEKSGGERIGKVEA